MQSIFRARDECRGRSASNALERGQHFADQLATALQRFADAVFRLVERLEAILGRRDFGFNVPQATGCIDQILIELSTVGADLVDLTLER